MNDDIGEGNNLIDEYPDRVDSLTILLEGIVSDGRSTPGEKQANDAEIDISKTHMNRSVK